MDSAIPSTQSHGGLLFPLDMFRPTMLAAALAESLLSKARNILDARLVLTRAATSPMVLARIEGSVLDGDPAAFWKSYPDLAMYASQVLPRQVFLYYATPGVDRHEGFVVAQRGQGLAADDSEQDTTPADSPDKVWPVARLCEQMQMSMDALAAGFPGGFEIELSLMEPSGDDQEMLKELAGQAAAEEGEVDAEEAEAGAEAGVEVQDGPSEHEHERDRPQRGGRRKRRGSGKEIDKTKVSADDDNKRRAALKAAELAEREARAEAITSDLPMIIDERGALVAPSAELVEAKILSTFLVAEVIGDMPEGVPRALLGELRGKAIDFAVRVDFLSEVFVGNVPLSRPMFEDEASDIMLGDTAVKRLEVLAPRLGTGTLLRRGRRNVFVSRRGDQPLPADFLLALFDGE
jgi:hypothetical protein